MRAAEHGNERAKLRIQTINNASKGGGIGSGRKKSGNGKLLTPSNNSSRLNSIDSNSKNNTNAQAGIENRRVSKSNNLEVPGQTHSLKSRIPDVVTSGGPRFSLGESPQRPKRGVLRKTRVQGGVIVGEEEEEMVFVSGRGDVSEKVASKDREKKDKGWFSGLWN